MNSVRKLCAAVSLPCKPKLQNTNPPEVPPSPPKAGPFCIKAHCDLVHEYDEVPIGTFTGYDTDYDIVKKTQNACKRKQNKFSKCEEVDVTVIPVHKIKTCNGHIVYKNYKNGATDIMFPR